MAGDAQAAALPLPASSAITYDQPVLTHAGRFYRQPGLTGQPPQVERSTWTLTVSGGHSPPMSLSYAEVRALPASGEMRTLVSRWRQPGGEQVGNAVWRGVRLCDLVPLHEPVPLHEMRRAAYVRLSGLDGYATTIPAALAQDVLLAYEMNGALLPPAHGGPLRALVPGVYGGKSVRWLGAISLVEQPERGLRECQPGEDDLLPVRTFAQIMTPQPYAHIAVGMPVALQGIAFAGRRRITRVELSIDAGAWVPATLRPPDSPHAWTQWYARWVPELAGPVSIAVRAADETGVLQAPEDSPQAEAIHRLPLVVA
ncbi:MAG: molybdopterin-dependent oxidoreductase [Anaerolineae bacterium]|nr:molybdopterin-dependent oxidoreductase [Anaerolineae bacterium]